MITINKIDKSNMSYLNTIDTSFVVTQRVIPKIEENREIGIQFKKVDPPYKKMYKDDDIDPAVYLNDSNHSAYFAFIDEKLAGQILLQRYWNKLGSIEDIRVSQEYRRNGVGRRLISIAKEWVLSQNINGLRLETQDINAGACLFYQACGFRLKGIDFNLYSAIPDSEDEIGLYWYLL